MWRRGCLAGGVAFLVFLATFAGAGFAVAAGTASTAVLPSSVPGSYHAPMSRAPAADTTGAFAFVSNFEDRALDGWTSLAGASPSVKTKPSYFGEPSLASSARPGAQIDVASSGFVTGDSFVSFQVALHVAGGSGYFALADASNDPVVVVGVSAGQVQAGPTLSSLTSLGAIPTDTVYPSGWVYLSANVYDASTHSNPNAGWVLQLFVDRSDMVAGNTTLSVPNAGSYSEALIETTSGTAYYTNIVVSTYEIPIFLPGYNNMEGYGQGSALLVQLLPAFTTLRAEMTLNSWNTPQSGILSFQINAMNLYGTTTSTCVGFFQLGIDLNPNGTIAPWYVPGKNCVAHYFLHSQNPAVQPGIASPADTHLVLTITDDTSAGNVVFTIVDTTIGQTFTASVPYGGGPFYGTYTQLEWQPCCSLYSIAEYQFSGALYDLTSSTFGGAVTPLGSDYMLPFTLDAPPQWSLTYYQESVQGYDQLA